VAGDGARRGMQRLRRSGRWKWILVPPLLVASVLWILNASRPGGRPRGCLTECSTGARRAEGPLRVLSLNMLHGFPRFERLDDRLSLIAAEIKGIDADIVCLQEVPWSWRAGDGLRRLGELAGLNYVGLRANGNRWAILFEEGAAILSRYPLSDPFGEELKPTAGFFQHRVVLKATAATPNGKLDVYVTHLTHNNPEANQAQAAALKMLVERTARNPAIVAGDLNAKPGSPQIELLVPAWVDSYRAANPDQPGFTCCVDDLTAKDGGRPTGPLVERIDYVFLVPGAGREVRVKSAARIFDKPFPVDNGWLWASDHAGLLVEVDWGSGR
jgi:endonuclease/exonuclease/phosphatase family metal-dependent hydrolase